MLHASKGAGRALGTTVCTVQGLVVGGGGGSAANCGMARGNLPHGDRMALNVARGGCGSTASTIHLRTNPSTSDHFPL